ncbi:MAG: hypothetical protein JNK49_11140 [Planctomycetes bacterium]|nr:hypothetical protein [Planctomycetota bacterium]
MPPPHRTWLACAAAAWLAAAATGQQRPKADVVSTPAIAAGLCVSNVFQSHMVLQRDRPIAVWGWAAPGEAVSAEFGGTTATTVAAADRSWRVTFAAQPANRTPQRLRVRGTTDELLLDDILIGDVWVLGGQSNMEFELEKVENGPLEIVSAHYPQIRVLTVPYGVGPEPQRSFARLHEWSDWFGRHFRKGDWDECTPQIASELSAIGFAFARRVHMASQVPIGIVDTSRGGTTVEAWTPLERLRKLDEPFLRTKLADWDRRAAEWDAAKDLAQRVAEHRTRVQKRLSAGEDVPAAEQRDPTDLRPGPLGDPNFPGHCHQGMLAPLAGLAVKGVLWHQGYNNAFDGMPGVRLYRAVLPELIRAWRAAFGDPELPFGILSLCTDGSPQTLDDYCEKMLDTGIYIREAHYQTFLALRQQGDQNVGYACTYDLRRSWYHPQVKLPAGERIARWAITTQYRLQPAPEWLPPQCLGMRAQDGALVLHFDTEIGDPVGGAIRGFAIAGDDRHFHPAEAVHLEVGKDERGRPRTDRKQLVLTSPMVRAPIHFRYGFGRNPLANLQALGNKDLPFPTQRSDDWALGEVPLGALDAAVDGRGALTREQTRRLQQALRQDDVRRRVEAARALLQAQGAGPGGNSDGKQ